MSRCGLYTLIGKSKGSDKQRHPTPEKQGMNGNLSWSDVRYYNCKECKHILTFDIGLTNVYFCKAKVTQ